MGFRFFYENGQGTVIDEHGDLSPLTASLMRSSILHAVSAQSASREGPRSDDMQTNDTKKDVDVHIREVSTKRVYTLCTEQGQVRFFNCCLRNV